MEVRIRMQKVGAKAKKHYNYRIVAIGRSRSRQGRTLDILGYYDPSKNPAAFKVELGQLDKWIKQGARMTDTVRTLVKQYRKKA